MDEHYILERTAYRTVPGVFFFGTTFDLENMNSTFEPCIFGVQLLELKCIFAKRSSFGDPRHLKHSLDVGLLQPKDRGMKLLMSVLSSQFCEVSE